MKKYNAVDFLNVNLTEGFWFEREKLNREVTLESVRQRFEDTGRFDAFEFRWKEGEDKRPHIFWDSDIAKWMESAAYILSKNKDERLEKLLDGLIDSIEKNQCGDGYFNSYYMLCEPQNRWTVRDNHELYCAGHLMEAAVAYYEATGKDKFLKLMCRYADYIEKVFKIEDSAAFSTPGHEEIELALVKMWKCTGEKRYLELSKHFVDKRGNSDKDAPHGISNVYLQDHKPLREQREAVGHCVRACYIYSGMADIAREYGDEELFKACEAIFNNIVNRRMYITGAIGSTHVGEAFTVDYDLPNDSAYAETSAAISLMFFAHRMSLLSDDSVYADIVERTIYNGIISGISLDGKSFFYENPLEINLKNRRSFDKHWPITQRLEVFGCSCCPPNITRIMPVMSGLIYSHGEDKLFVKQFMSSQASFEMDGKKVDIIQETQYPENGKVKLTVKGLGGKTLMLRAPDWCKEVEVRLNSEQIAPEQENGYLAVKITSDEAVIEYEMEMKPFFVESNARVWENIGKVALQKGPVVYCSEDIDSVFPVFNLFVDIFEKVNTVYDEKLGLNCLEAGGFAKSACGCHGGLYAAASGNYLPTKIKFIPYYAFANRGESDMRVWMTKF